MIKFIKIPQQNEGLCSTSLTIQYSFQCQGEVNQFRKSLMNGDKKTVSA